MAVKHKGWVDNVARVRGDLESRHSLLRLEKNERITHFPDALWGDVVRRLTQEHVLAYPETERFYGKLAKFHGMDVSNFVLTAGSDAAIRNAFDLCVRPGDAVVTLDPTFAMVDVYCRLYGAEKRGISYSPSLEVDMGRLMASLDEKATLAVIANANSPTGTLIPPDDMERIIAKAAATGIVVLVDEAYYGFGSPTCISLTGKYENVMVTRTFSKACGLAGLRIGYIAAHPRLAELLYKFRPMYEVNSVALLFAETVLERYEEVERYCADSLEGKAYLQKQLDRLGMRHHDCHTNFIHVDFADRKQRAIDLFDRQGIKVRGGLAIPGFENCLRVSYGPVEPMRRLVGALEALWA